MDQYFRRSPPTIDTRRSVAWLLVVGCWLLVSNLEYTWFVTTTGMFCFLAISFSVLNWFANFRFTSEILSESSAVIASPNSNLYSIAIESIMIRDMLSCLTCFSICSKDCCCSLNEVGFRRRMFWRSFSISSFVPWWTCLNRSTENPPSVSMKITLFPFLAWDVATMTQKFDFPEPPGP